MEDWMETNRLRLVHAQTTAMTAASIPAKITDEKLQHAINISKRAMQFGKLPESVLRSDQRASVAFASVAFASVTFALSCRI